MEDYWHTAPEADSEFVQQGSSEPNGPDELLDKAISSNASDEYFLTDYGIQHALKHEMLPLPIPTSKRARKDAMYIERLGDHRKILERELEHAEIIYEQARREREVNTDTSLNGMIALDLIKAEHKLGRAQRNYSMFLGELKELRDMPLLPREKMETEVTVHRKQAHRDLKEQDDIEDGLLATNPWKLQMAKAEEKMRDLRIKLEALSQELVTVKEENRGFRKQVENADFEKLKATVTLKGRLTDQIQEYNKMVDNNYRLQQQITALERDIDRLRFATQPAPSPTDTNTTLTQDLKSTHTEQSGNGSDTDSNATVIFSSKAQMLEQDPPGQQDRANVTGRRSKPVLKLRLSAEDWVVVSQAEADGSPESERGGSNSGPAGFATMNLSGTHFDRFDGGKQYYSLAGLHAMARMIDRAARRVRWADTVLVHGGADGDQQKAMRGSVPVAVEDDEHLTGGKPGSPSTLRHMLQPQKDDNGAGGEYHACSPGHPPKPEVTAATSTALATEITVEIEKDLELMEAKCKWHAEGSCEILSPGSQARTGRFCKAPEQQK